ncbi:MAG TPA: MlaD family protein [Myxococcaceae bacterium]|nr:MlaD family protein [Myxococcaceae bacterium]
MTQETAEQKERRIVVRAGLFVGLGLTLLAVVVLLIGKANQVFERQVAYHMYFENVEGLKTDSPVWLGGLEVGRVTAIAFVGDIEDQRIDVKVEVARRFANRIRTDSVARISGRGVLGDKAIDISIGSAKAEPVPPGGLISSGSSGELTTLLKKGGELLDNAVVITRDLRRAVAAYSDPSLKDDVAATVASLRGILGRVEKGPGAVHALLYDRQAGEEVPALLARLSSVAARVDRAVNDVDALLEAARTGPGALHALFYDPQAGKAVGALGEASTELAQLIHDARTSPDGAVHQLVYGDAKNLFANLGGVAADLKAITGTIRSGEGTLGALVNDPSVYDDLRTILGNLKRNRALRELVRMTLPDGGEAKSGKPAGAPPPPPTVPP